MGKLSEAIAHREQLRRLHNEPGHGDDPEWRRDIFKPTQMSTTKRINAARRCDTGSAGSGRATFRSKNIDLQYSFSPYASARSYGIIF